jgi:hypothetical protein
MRSVFFASAAALVLGAAVRCPAETGPGVPTPLLDRVALGDPQSERAHGLTETASRVDRGALGEPARQLLPGGRSAWEGGTLMLSMKVDLQRQTYVTARFWGSEVNENYLFLFCDGKQVGYRHLGDVDVLALPEEAPRYNGRFYYVTTPLPLAMTHGKGTVQLEVRATGPLSAYSGTFDKYQKPMVTPSQDVYRLYTHADGAFTPPADERQGTAPVATARAEPGPEVIAAVQERVNTSIDGLLAARKPLNQMQVQFLGRAYFVPWTHAHSSPKAVTQVVAGVDELYRRWRQNPDDLWNDKATWNPGWFAVGPGADAVRLMAGPLGPALDQPLDGQPRRAAWSALFQAGRDWLRVNRRWLTNQAMFTDSNLYLCDRAVAAIDPDHALPAAKASDYLYQCVGLVPWLGPDTPRGPERPFGNAFFEVTDKGLTRERGYSGSYGEVGVEGAMDVYNATRIPGGQGDPKLRAQLAKMVRARAPFRYPMLDEDGHPAMRLETVVGWRDTHVPGEVAYAQRGAFGMTAAAATLDPDVVGYAQQMLADHQFFSVLARVLTDNRFRTTTSLLDVPDDYRTIRAQPPTGRRLPLSWDQPDGVHADEEDGVVAIKNGTEILYASLYWRAGYGVNFLARTHYLTPNYEQTAVVREEATFEPSGQVYRRPDWINFGFGNGGTNIRYPADLHQASAGEELPIAKPPPGVRIKAGDESHFAGKAEFYVLRFGRYLIAMNTTADQSFPLTVQGAAGPAMDLGARLSVPAGSVLRVGPRSTVVLYWPAS